jgi:hypothetical protein
MNRDQLLTVGDLEHFKISLLEEIRKLLGECKDKSGEHWIRSKEVRKMLGISAGTLQNLRINGTLPYIRMGGIILYKYEDIASRLNERKSG